MTNFRRRPLTLNAISLTDRNPIPGGRCHPSVSRTPKSRLPKTRASAPAARPLRRPDDAILDTAFVAGLAGGGKGVNASGGRRAINRVSTDQTQTPGRHMAGPKM